MQTKQQQKQQLASKKNGKKQLASSASHGVGLCPGADRVAMYNGNTGTYIFTKNQRKLHFHCIPQYFHPNLVQNERKRCSYSYKVDEILNILSSIENVSYSSLQLNENNTYIRIYSCKKVGRLGVIFLGERTVLQN